MGSKESKAKLLEEQQPQRDDVKKSSEPPSKAQEKEVTVEKGPSKSVDETNKKTSEIENTQVSEDVSKESEPSKTLTRHISSEEKKIQVSKSKIQRRISLERKEESINEPGIEYPAVEPENNS